MFPRAALAIAGAVVALGTLVPTVTASALVGSDGSPRVASDSWASAGAAGSGVTLAPCADGAYSLIGGYWPDAVHWTFNVSTTPKGMNASATEAIVRKSYSSITDAYNDCGRADKVSARNVYEGHTTRFANVSKGGWCTQGDNRNVVSFVRLPIGVLAVTCTETSHGRITEADIRISSRYNWALAKSSCSHQELLEPTLTHEVGHVYGLGHVGERKHPLLTMSVASDGACNNAASTLALGDMLGLESLY
ncbi:MAG: hypothetical protein ABIP53_04570 [Candidatus Limnocylindrales bacterium]